MALVYVSSRYSCLTKQRVHQDAPVRERGAEDLNPACLCAQFTAQACVQNMPRASTPKPTRLRGNSSAVRDHVWTTVHLQFFVPVHVFCCEVGCRRCQ